MTTNYYQVPLHYVPFEQIPSLENANLNFGYVSFLSLYEKMQIDFHLVTFFDNFGDKTTVEALDNSSWLCGQVLAESSASRGKVKFKAISTKETELSDEEYPHMKYCNIHHQRANDSSGNWFYLNEGKYLGMYAKKSEFEKVNHLEGISMHTDPVLRLKIVIELLKRNVRNNIVTLSENDYYQMAYKVIKADPSLKADEETAQIIVNIWMPQMLSVPAWDDIPSEIRGRVRA